jgi:hypothetical protein
MASHNEGPSRTFRGFDPRRRRRRRTSAIGAALLAAMGTLLSGVVTPVRYGLGQMSVLLIIIAMMGVAIAAAVRPEPLLTPTGLRLAGTSDGRHAWFLSHFVPFGEIRRVVVDRHSAWVRLHIHGTTWVRQADFWDPDGGMVATLKAIAVARGFSVDGSQQGRSG